MTYKEEKVLKLCFFQFNFFLIKIISCLYLFLLNLAEEKKPLESCRLCGNGWWSEEGDPNYCPREKGYGWSPGALSVGSCYGDWALRRNRIGTATPSSALEGSGKVSLSLVLHQGKPNVTILVYIYNRETEWKKHCTFLIMYLNKNDTNPNQGKFPVVI